MHLALFEPIIPGTWCIIVCSTGTGTGTGSLPSLESGTRGVGLVWSLFRVVVYFYAGFPYVCVRVYN
jgi:hypothetical protein